MSDHDWNAQDRQWMAQALALGALAEGDTSPNPRVGCVLVRDGRVVGRGLHRAPGLPHAEAEAVDEAGDHAHGATLYVNLEPCAHHGRTAPCADLLIRCGVSRVVAAIQDPNPLVDGRGFASLRRARIAVEVGLMAEEAHRLNAAFFHWHRHRRPLVTLKAALSADGQLSASDGHSRWITGHLARRFAHRLRLRHDAILVGAGTVRRDDPWLTVRLGGISASRRRIVLSRRLDLDPRAHVFADADGGPAPRIYTSAQAPAAAVDALASQAEIVRVTEGPTGLVLTEVLDDLAGIGIQALLVEGGGRTLGSFLASGLAQRAALFVSDKLVGARGATPFLDVAAAAEPALARRLRRRTMVPFGDDFVVLGDLCDNDSWRWEACSRES